MIQKTKWPTVSIIMPTLNEEARLPTCLDSIKKQNYPQNKIEIIIGDANSKDNTVKIAQKYGAKVYKNPLKTSESGKRVAEKHSKGELICTIDADNILPEKDWLTKMVTPLIQNPQLLGSEALHFTYRKKDGFIDRYCALIGMNDPLCLWLGVYDRMSVLTNKWTGLSVKQKQKKGYIELTLEKGNIPTIGANGAIFRKKIFQENPELVNDYLFDTDILEHLVTKHGPVKFAKVDVGVIHLYCGSNVKKFTKKQLRRVKDYLYRRQVSEIFLTNKFTKRKYKYGHNSSIQLTISILKFCFSCILVFPLIWQSFVGYSRKKDLAWFAHPILCWITMITYTYGTMHSFIRNEELSRKNW